MSAKLKRREFFTLIGSAAAGWPLAVWAQIPGPTRHIGVLMFYAENDQQGKIRAEALEEQLQTLGWVKGRNLTITYRWGNRFQPYAIELVRLKVDAIITVSTPALIAVQHETRTIPIVFTQVSDPLGQGIVKNVARPGGNVTGFSNYDPSISGKWLELLKEAAPSVTRAAIIFNPTTAPYTRLYMHSIEAVASSVRVNVTTAPVHNDADIEEFFAKHGKEPGGGLIVMTDAFTSTHRKQIIELAAQFALPAVYPYRYYVVDGGLMSYGIEQVEQIRGAAIYLDRILKGERAGDLPVQAPTKYRLTVNLKTGKGLGLNMPPMLLGRADEVIE